MRVVFDTNVLYSAFAAKGFCEEVLDEAAGDCVTIWSNPLKQELELLLARRHKPCHGSCAGGIRRSLRICGAVAVACCVCRDKDDDIVLATAVAGKADVIVTGDDDLLALKKFRDIRILSPRQFLEFLDRG